MFLFQLVLSLGLNSFKRHFLLLELFQDLLLLLLLHPFVILSYFLFLSLFFILQFFFLLLLNQSYSIELFFSLLSLCRFSDELLFFSLLKKRVLLHHFFHFLALLFSFDLILYLFMFLDFLELQSLFFGLFFSSFELLSHFLKL